MLGYRNLKDVPETLEYKHMIPPPRDALNETDKQNAAGSFYFEKAEALISELKDHSHDPKYICELSGQLKKLFEQGKQNNNYNELQEFVKNLIESSGAALFDSQMTRCLNRATKVIEELRRYCLRANIVILEKYFSEQQCLAAQKRSSVGLLAFVEKLEIKLKLLKEQSSIGFEPSKYLVEAEQIIEELSHFPKYKTQKLMAYCKKLFESLPQAIESDFNDHLCKARYFRDIVKSNLNLAKVEKIFDELVPLCSEDDLFDIEFFKEEIFFLKNEVQQAMKTASLAHTSPLLSFKTTILQNQMQDKLKKLHKKVPVKLAIVYERENMSAEDFVPSPEADLDSRRAYYFNLSLDLIEKLKESHSEKDILFFRNRAQMKFNLDKKNNSDNEIYVWYEQLCMMVFQLEVVTFTQRKELLLTELKKHLFPAQIKKIENDFSVVLAKANKAWCAHALILFLNSLEDINKRYIKEKSKANESTCNAWQATLFFRRESVSSEEQKTPAARAPLDQGAEVKLPSVTRGSARKSFD